MALKKIERKVDPGKLGPLVIEDDGTIRWTKDGEPKGVVAVMGHPDRDMKESDWVYARLFLAAPNMLRALIEAKHILGAYIPPDNFDGHAARALVMVRDAIDEATK